MRVLELMKSHVIKTSPDATVRDAIDMFDLYQITGLPVVDAEDKLLGIITEYDIVRLLLPNVAPDAAKAVKGDVRPALAIRESSVTQVMSAPPIAVDENTDVQEAASLMLARRIKRLPVTSDGRLVGMISRMDICQALIEGQIEPQG